MLTNIKTTKEQEAIIEEGGNCVVVAKPGSGKTYVLSEKIKIIIPELPEYKGVIAISYTNKASKELERRSLSGGLYKKASFFGTIDRFFISEIVIPFGQQLFGMCKNDIDIKKINDLEADEIENFEWFSDGEPSASLIEANMTMLKKYFIEGIIILETVPFLSIYIFDNSRSCRNYLKARYSHIFIDEYQDSGEEQHKVFLRLKNLGLTAIAVGDINQSIFGFAGKSSIFLSSLPQEGLKLLPLTYNHRSHNSIINYSSVLLDKNFALLEADRINVFASQVVGDERVIAKWIDKAALFYKDKFNIASLKDIGILTRNDRTAQIIDNSLKLEHKLFTRTKLDNDINRCSLLFRNLLYCSFDKNETKYDLLEDLLDLENNKIKANKIIAIMKKTELLFENLEDNKHQILIFFEDIYKELFNAEANEKSLELLLGVLSNTVDLESYYPAEDNKINIMTLHKSKGLEFDLVFHLDMYEWILPKKRIEEGGGTSHPSYLQDLNLHYVGVTRAKKCCVLLSSTIRHNYELKEKTGNMSEFFYLENLNNLRITK